MKGGQVVLDMACGTGANFKHLKVANLNLQLYGVDYSEGMLNKASKTIEKNNWQNIKLFKADARDLNRSFLDENVGEELSVDRIICFLGLSAIPDWEKVMDNLLNLLNENGKIVIVDVYAEKRDFNTWMVEKVAKADLDRKIWQRMEKRVSNFHQEYLPVKESKVGGKLFVAVGEKP